MTRQQVLDLYFLDARHKLIEIAAFLDRVDRADGKDDFRLKAFRAALAGLTDGKKQKAKNALLAFSDLSTKPIEKAGGKGAVGAASNQKKITMFRWFKRRRAIKSYVFRLSLELFRRFGQKTFYSIDNIDRVFAGGKYDKNYISYAYALFCSRAEFDSYFSQLKVNCTYDGLRKYASKKYFRGVVDFNASEIAIFAKNTGGDSYYESSFGEQDSSSDH